MNVLLEIVSCGGPRLLLEGHHCKNDHRLVTGWCAVSTEVELWRCCVHQQECMVDCCREDLQKQKELAPRRYQDHSTAYFAGRPPSAKNTLLPGDTVLAPGQEDSD